MCKLSSGVYHSFLISLMLSFFFRERESERASWKGFYQVIFVVIVFCIQCYLLQPKLHTLRFNLVSRRQINNLCFNLRAQESNRSICCLDFRCLHFRCLLMYISMGIYVHTPTHPWPSITMTALHLEIVTIKCFRKL